MFDAPPASLSNPPFGRYNLPFFALITYTRATVAPLFTIKNKQCVPT